MTEAMIEELRLLADNLEGSWRQELVHEAADTIKGLTRLVERCIALIESAEKDTNWCGGDPYGDSASKQIRAELAKLPA